MHCLWSIAWRVYQQWHHWLETCLVLSDMRGKTSPEGNTCNLTHRATGGGGWWARPIMSHDLLFLLEEKVQNQKKPKTFWVATDMCYSVKSEQEGLYIFWNEAEKNGSWGGLLWKFPPSLKGYGIHMGGLMFPGWVCLHTHTCTSVRQQMQLSSHLCP